MTSMKQIRLLTSVMQYTGIDIARLAQLSGSNEVSLITDATSDVQSRLNENPLDVPELPKLLLPVTKLIRSPLKPIRCP